MSCTRTSGCWPSLTFTQFGPDTCKSCPRSTIRIFDDMPGAICALIVRLGQQLAVAMKQIYGVPRVAFLFSGGDIAHAHAHVVPMHEETDITSRRYIAEDVVTFRSTPRASDTDLAPRAIELREAFASSVRTKRAR